MTSQTPSIEPIAYDIPSFCAAVKVGKSTVYNEIAAGALQVCKVGDRTLIEVDEAKRWLASKRADLTALPWKPHTKRQRAA